MALWQRLLVTLAAMLAASFVIGLAWHSIFSVRLPSYIGGMVGGITAIPVWEFLKRVGPKSPKT